MGRVVKLHHVYGADLETDNDGYSAWIVQWAISTGDSEYTGRTLQEFWNKVLEIVYYKHTVVLYFHNLKYDLEFLKAGFHELELMGWTPKYILRKGEPIKCRIDKGCMSIEVRDSLKKIPGSSVRSLGKLIGLPKLDPPGTETFEPGWSQRLDYSEGSLDWEYVKRDARIVARAMRMLHRRGFSRATLSGDAWACCKVMCGTSDGCDHGPDKWKWKYIMPALSPELDAKLRRGYWGGINLSANVGVNEASEDLPITHEDIHNSYGAVMRWDPMPYGTPAYQTTMPEDYQFWIGHFRIKMKIRDGLMPWFQFKNGVDCLLEGWDYGTLVTETKVWHDVTMTSIDLNVLSDWYEVEIDDRYPMEFWVFTTRCGFVEPYLDQFTKIKESSKKDTLEYLHAKRMINSVYGRSGLALETEEVTLVWDDDIGDWNWSREYSINEDNDSYIPYAMAATSYARARLLENVKACLEQMPGSVIHCDTDSVIHYGPPCDSIEHGEHLGTWGIESEPPVIIEGGFKRYVELRQYPMQSMDDLIGMALAGVPQRRDKDGCPIGMWIEVLDDPRIILQTGHILGHEHYHVESDWLADLLKEHGYDPDNIDTRKLIPRKVPGGVILEGRTHQLNDNLRWRLRR